MPPPMDSDKMLVFVVVVFVFMCAPVVMMTIIGVLTPMRRGIAYKATGGVMGFVIGTMTTAGIVMLFFWSRQSPNPIIDVDTRVGFIVLYVGCCTVGIIVTVALIYLLGRIRRILMLRSGADT